MAQLPDSVQEIANVIGQHKALYLVGRLPRVGKRSWRCELYVPKVLDADSDLVRILGWDDALKITKEFGGEILQPANCGHLYMAYRNRQINRLFRDGHSLTFLADLFGMTERRIRGILEKSPVSAQ